MVKVPMPHQEGHHNVGLVGLSESRPFEPDKDLKKVIIAKDNISILCHSKLFYFL